MLTKTKSECNPLFAVQVLERVKSALTSHYHKEEIMSLALAALMFGTVLVMFSREVLNG